MSFAIMMLLVPVAWACPNTGRMAFAFMMLLVPVAWACPNTCYEATCDDWDKSCSELETWGCDCTGCACAVAESESDDGGKGADDGWGKTKGTPSPTAARGGAWATATLGDRSYKVYDPAVPLAGAMLFFHGDTGDADSIAALYQVAAAADARGFLGVVPDGSPVVDADCPCEWNVDDVDGVDEVAFVHDLVAALRSDFDLGEGAPVVALGFSNGAAVSALLGCHDSYDLWVAHVATLYDEAAASYPSTCASSTNAAPEWSAIGEDDYFLDGLGVDGLLDQFAALRDAQPGCPATEAAALSTLEDGAECYSYAECPEVGELCVYPDLGHAAAASMAPRAWAFLAGDTSTDDDDTSAAARRAGVGGPLAVAFLLWARFA